MWYRMATNSRPQDRRGDTETLVDQDASVGPDATLVLERCDECGDRTPHVATIEFLVESVDSEHSANSRQPYRVTECRECGTSTRKRATNA